MSKHKGIFFRFIASLLSHQQVSVGADTTSVTFSGLTDAYPMYAYDVKSVFEYEGQTAYYTSKEKIFVNLKNGTSTTGIEEITSESNDAT